MRFTLLLSAPSFACMSATTSSKISTSPSTHTATRPTWASAIAIYTPTSPLRVTSASETASPINSGIYVGTVGAYKASDLALTCDLPAMKPHYKATFSIDTSNMFDNCHWGFIGAPKIGHLVSAGLVVGF